MGRRWPLSREDLYSLRLLSCLSQLLWAGQGWPAEEVPQSLAQLLEQTAVVSSPSDLLALVGTMTFLAKVVADTRIQLHRSALEVSSEPQQVPAG